MKAWSRNLLIIDGMLEKQVTQITQRFLQGEEEKIYFIFVLKLSL